MDLASAGVLGDELSYDEIRENDIGTLPSPSLSKRQRFEEGKPTCTLCLNGTLLLKTALYLCLTCEYYLCINCYPEHRDHVCSTEEGFAENKSLISSFTSDLFNEQDLVQKFGTETVLVHDRINLKHEFDKNDGWITRLCFVDKHVLVVCDCFNFCLKMLKEQSGSIHRYIRLGSKPYDITRVQSNKSFFEGSQDKPLLLVAVSFPGQRLIMLIDVGYEPAEKVNAIRIARKCHSIEFYDDSLFVICEENPHPDISRFFVHVMSLQGEERLVIPTNINRVVMFPPPYISLASDRIYVTNWSNHSIESTDLRGQNLEGTTLAEAWPYGISADNDGNIFVCAGRDTTLYKISADLKIHETIARKENIYMEFPRDLAFNRNKLYVSHFLGSAIGNFVTVLKVV